ncbi:type II toxin-antitoxin system VapC family toxin [Sphingomonas sp. RP10(2022)]|uniref:Type II toxin-antitoxin system VapC family toxin n=1 Tax=Sphingomonas liriopis TaxID=2949094 RepID=A0A9X2KRJ9_9SPHN|nr:type II toxin-antitoxin system VapC family toxin [Sphingomonas liriopis]MCP3736105.1 type II toxin-antitoxin system VapC family toxin [Sphingomonas liriopis]
MKAIDTNVIARYVTNDDPVQSPIATAVLANPCYISDTVLLEAAWLLASRYRFGRALLAETLSDLIELLTVAVSDAGLIRWAIERFADGADFADMMHLISGRHADAFVSFEDDLARLAGADTPLGIEKPR